MRAAVLPGSCVAAPSGLRAALAAAPLALAIEPLRHAVESRMLLHMFVEFPLLLAAGLAVGPALERGLPRLMAAVEAADLVMLDLKHMDASEHARGTGVDNRLVLENLELLISSGRRFVARVPLIPGYSDTPENLAATAARLAPAKGRVAVELMPFNPLAGAKYALVGRPYRPLHETGRSPRSNLAPFQALGLDASLL